MVLMYGKTVFSYQLESSGILLLSAEEMPTPCGSKEMLLQDTIQELCFVRLVCVCVLIQL